MILIFLSILLSVFSLNPTPKFCINCKFFTKSLNSEFKYGKCALFPTIKYKEVYALFPLEKHDLQYLVCGIRNTDYFYCSTARSCDKMCGIEGKKYEENDN